MSLIKCPECNKDVSTKATSCPHCGAPISPPQETKVVTERTSKSYKGKIVACVIIIFLGFITLFSGEKDGFSTGGWMIGVGIVGYFVTKIAIWWQHD